ncbi:type I restriction enzyme, S subunit [Candidatus Electrothrix aarhusensis]|uniref:Type I restriction enzyme, S subunit n=1 Tax=Candidatus Electrothrix aarhusensis TaxID=1859131 RepID=A0A444ITF9_9BACT|nr:type I restriction enzyme, S subunit [Candidatus Electrothrix aarhusensis]
MREDWVEGKLGDVLSVKNGYAFKSSEYQHEGIPIIRISDIKQGVVKATHAKRIVASEEFDNYQVEFGDILIAMSGATTGKFGIYQEREKTYQNQRVGNLKPHFDNHLIKRYIYYLLYSLRQRIEKDAHGGAQPNISGKKIEAIEFCLAPLPEQRAIVAKVEQLFSELDNGVANLKAAKDKLEIFRQAVLQKAFEGELTKEWRTKNYCDQSDFLKSLINDKNEAISKKLIKKDNYFPELTKERLIYNPPDNWLHLPWKTICKNNKYAMKRGPFGSALKKAFFVDSGYTVYEQGHAINDDPYRDRYFISEERYQDLKAFRVKPGDMIISCSGVTLGRICLLPDDCNSGIINQALLKIDLDERVILKKFFLIMFRSEAFQRKIFQKSLGTAMPNMVSMTELKELLIPVPSIEEQTQIVQEIETRLSVCDNAIANIEESLTKSEALRQSILKKAFAGKLLTDAELQACRQEPDWEPAAKLLERIKHDKKSTPRKKSTT